MVSVGKFGLVLLDADSVLLSDIESKERLRKVTLRHYHVERRLEETARRPRAGAMPDEVGSAGN